MRRGFVEFVWPAMRVGFAWLATAVVGRVYGGIVVLGFFGIAVVIPKLTAAPGWLAVPSALLVVLVVFMTGAYIVWNDERKLRRAAEAREAETLARLSRSETVLNDQRASSGHVAAGRVAAEADEEARLTVRAIQATNVDCGVRARGRSDVRVGELTVKNDLDQS